MATSSGTRIGRVFVEIGADLTKLQAGLRRAKFAVDRFASQIQLTAQRALTAGTAIAAPLTLAARTFTGFSDQMKAVQAISGATAAEFAQLAATAMRLGESTSFSAAQVAEAMLNLSRAGFRPAETNNAIAGMLDLARATGTNLAEAADIAAGTLRAFNLDAKEMGHVADVLTATANNSAQTMTDLGEAMKFVAPIAAEAGISLEETAKSIGVLANMQIKGSTAGTSLRQILLSLADPTVRKKIADLGVSVTDAAGNLRTDLGTMLAEIGQAIARLPNAERLSILADLFDQRAAGAAAKLAAADIAALSAAIDNSAGVAARTAKIMDSGLGGAWRRLKSAVEGAQIAMSQTFDVLLSPILDKLSQSTTAAAQWIRENQAFAAVIAAAAAGLLAFGGALLAGNIAIRIFSSGLSAILSIMSLLSAAFTAAISILGIIITPIGSVATALAILAAHAIYVSGAWKPVFSFLAKSFQWVSNIFSQVWGGISDALTAGDLKLAGEIAMTGLRIAWIAGTGKLKNLWADFVAAIVEVFSGAAIMIQDLWSKTVEGIAKRILDTAASNSILAKGLRVDLGVDVKAENERAARLEAQRVEMLKRRLAEAEARGDTAAAADIRRSLAAAGKPQTAQDILAENMNRGRERTREQFGELAAYFRQAAADTRAENEEALAKQEEELRRLRELAAAAKESAQQPPAPGPDVPEAPPPLPEPQQIAAAVAAAVPGTTIGQSAGTFSAYAARGLGITGPLDRMNRTLEEMLRETKRVADNTEEPPQFI